MNRKHARRLFLVCVVVIVLLAAMGFANRSDNTANGNVVFDLQAPPFMAVAWAEEESITSVIEDEAGIAAYFQASTPPDMSSVRDAFRTIEYENNDYIIGSVEVANYPESEDVHVYVDTEGWILAYYLATDPAGKIFDWRAYSGSGHTDLTTKLGNTLIKVASYAVVSYPGCTYYDFRYPNATHLILIADWVYYATDSFQVNLPGTFTYYERSWSIGYSHDGKYTLDGVQLYYQNPQSWATTQGFLTLNQLLPNQFHTIEVYGRYYAYGGLALVYRVP